MDSGIGQTWHQVQNHTALSLECTLKSSDQWELKMTISPESQNFHIPLYKVAGVIGSAELLQASRR